MSEIVLTDAALRLALLQAEEAEYARLLPGEREEPVPAQLRRRLRPLLSDPTGARRRGRHALARSAAAAALAAAVTAGTVLAVSPEARAWARNLIVEILEEYTTVRFVDDTGTQTGAPGAWAPAWLPEGYELVEVVDLGQQGYLKYENSSSAYILLEFSKGNTVYHIDNEHHTAKEVLINGNPGYLLLANSSGEASTLTWADEGSGTSFSLLAELSENELIKIAESVKKN